MRKKIIVLVSIPGQENNVGRYIFPPPVPCFLNSASISPGWSSAPDGRIQFPSFPRVLRPCPVVLEEGYSGSQLTFTSGHGTIRRQPRNPTGSALFQVALSL